MPHCLYITFLSIQIHINTPSLNKTHVTKHPMFFIWSTCNAFSHKSTTSLKTQHSSPQAYFFLPKYIHFVPCCTESALILFILWLCIASSNRWPIREQCGATWGRGQARHCWQLGAPHSDTGISVWWKCCRMRWLDQDWRPKPVWLPDFQKKSIQLDRAWQMTPEKLDFSILPILDFRCFQSHMWIRNMESNYI